MSDVIQDLPPSMFSGIVVFVDDEIEKPDSYVYHLKENFNRSGFPVLIYKELPWDFIENFHSISYVLLDWNLNAGLSVGHRVRENVEFIQRIRNKTLAPIIVFSALSKEEIVEEIKTQICDDPSNELSSTEISNLIIISKADNLSFKELMEEIYDDIKNQTSLYALKEWELSLRNAKQEMVSFFYKISVDWAAEYYRASVKDNTDPAFVLQEMLFDNLKVRQTSISLDQEIFNQHNSEESSEANSVVDGNADLEEDLEINEIIQAGMFYKYDDKKPEMVFAGDVFKDSEDNYYVNIRPQCDCIPRSIDLDEVELYLVPAEYKSYKGHYKTKRKLDSELRSKPAPVYCVVQPFKQGTLILNFKKFCISKYARWKHKRIGRFLPPQLSYIVQTFCLFLQRPGLPPYPRYKS